jgi:hypothetical protein
MDDKNKTQGQVQTQQQPVGGVGSLVKEYGPVAIRSSPEPEIRSEVEHIVVKSAPEFPEVKPEHQAVGISPAKESVPVQTKPSGLTQIPMTEEEAMQTLKNTKPTESRFGLATVILKFFKTLHHKLLINKN